jgi:TRAP-type C4-dicarboxylate transport system substrate-binding protein
MKEIRKGAQNIAEQTSGRVKFKFYTGGVMGNEKSVLKKMRIGQLHGGAFSAGGLAEVFADSQIYSLPFLFRTYSEVDFVRDKMDTAIRDGLAKNNMIVLGITEGGFAYLMSDIPVRAVSDLKHKKVWLPEGDDIAQTVYDIAGIAAIPLPLSDVYTGLQTGMIDTASANPTTAIALQWHTRFKYVADIPLLYVYGIVAMDKKAFSKISAADQSIVLNVMSDVLAKLGKLNREDDAQARAALEKQGIEFLSIAPKEQKHWEEIAEKSIEALAAKGIYSPELYNKLMEYLRTYRSQNTSSGPIPAYMSPTSIN